MAANGRVPEYRAIYPRRSTPERADAFLAESADRASELHPHRAAACSGNWLKLAGDTLSVVRASRIEDCRWPAVRWLEAVAGRPSSGGEEALVEAVQQHMASHGS